MTTNELREAAQRALNLLLEHMVADSEGVFAAKDATVACDLRTALTAPSAATNEAAGQWQPIASAPMDGRRVLVWWGGQWRSATWLDNSKTSHPWAGWKVPSLEPRPAGGPTHWMEPAAPGATTASPAPAAICQGLLDSCPAPQQAEPVAWRVRRHDAPDYWIVFLHKPVDALQDPEREVQPLYTHPAPAVDRGLSEAIEALSTWRPVRLELGVTMHRDVNPPNAGEWLRKDEVLAALSTPSPVAPEPAESINGPAPTKACMTQDLPTGAGTPAGPPSRSQRLREAGFTARDTRIECDECGAKCTPQMLPIHQCAEPVAPGGVQSEGHLPMGWIFNHTQASSDPGKWEIGFMDDEDDRFSPIVTVDTGLYYKAECGEPLARAILARLCAAPPAPASEAPREVVLPDPWDFNHRGKDLGLWLYEWSLAPAGTEKARSLADAVTSGLRAYGKQCAEAAKERG